MHEIIKSTSIHVFFQVDCDELKRKEHFVRYFKIRNSDIEKLDDHIFMGMKIEHLYIHNSSEFLCHATPVLERLI